jgi:hypothetical protein
MDFPQNPLAEAIYTRLTAALDRDVYAQGAVPTDAGAPYIVVPVGRLRGDETLDRRANDTVRQSLRVHTTAPAGEGSYAQANRIAGEAYQALRGNLTVDGSDVYVPRPDTTPVSSYSKGPVKARDVSVLFIFRDL